MVSAPSHWRAGGYAPFAMGIVDNTPINAHWFALPTSIRRASSGRRLTILPAAQGYYEHVGHLVVTAITKKDLLRPGLHR